VRGGANLGDQDESDLSHPRRILSILATMDIETDSAPSKRRTQIDQTVKGKVQEAKLLNDFLFSLLIRGSVATPKFSG